MSKTPMPSPRGTNYAGLFVGSKVQAAYDEAPDDGPADGSALTDSDGSPVVDSAQAHRILAACIDKLSKSDMSRLMDMMKEAELITDEEVRSIEAGMSGDGERSDMASDASIRARRRHQYDAGLISYDQLRAPIVKVQSSEDRARFLAMFPDAERLG